MKLFTTIAVLLAFVTSSLAHIAVYGAWINKEYQGDGQNVYVRPYAFPNNPMRNANWTYIACNTLGHRVQREWLKVKVGDELAFEWYWLVRGDFYTGTHVGPLLVYIAPAVDTGVNTPEIWTKLYHYGYSSTHSKWADDFFLKNSTATNGHHYIKVPDLPAGKYLIRSEVITLQDASTENGAQHYPSCTQIEITSNGSVELPGGVSFPGTYIPGQPGLVWRIKSDDPTNYPLPGGPVWEGSPGGGIYGLDS